MKIILPQDTMWDTKLDHQRLYRKAGSPSHRPVQAAPWGKHLHNNLVVHPVLDDTARSQIQSIALAQQLLVEHVQLRRGKRELAMSGHFSRRQRMGAFVYFASKSLILITYIVY